MIYRTEAGGQQIRRRYQQLLASWPVPAEHLRVPTREGETFVVVSGPRDAPPLVLFHGSGANAAAWMGDVAAWSGKFRVYAVDMIGEPGLSAPSRPPLGGDAYVRWLDDVFEALGLDQVSIAGMSLGGWLALAYATRRPERVARLVLLCPGGVGRQKYGWLVKTLLYKPFGERGLRRSLKTVAGMDAAASPEAFAYLQLIFTHFLPRKEKLPVFGDDALRRLTMPVLVIAGARDAMLDSFGTERRIRQAVPHAKVTILPEVAHAVLGQTEPVLEFLTG
ncbi:alpha/beta fold hydrolase [Amycolatopsis alkalitolerans]|uniref:Alpha/beta fold hydrolase n=1 Tax=Amycolatopsis alkalitolerans TaxID=2547244 RepID=A0A5C4LVK4_9PSEU|nr:alpha/beta fold hydrolase [Amycolatopsis alkalitolerans]TNC22609.1 alpha/beta fold hydrolase [Amycolatopsis alkalitolerans]